MEKMVIVFIVCSLINVILSTLKTLIMVNAGRGSAIIINAVCYGFYTLVVKQLTSVDYVTAVTVTILANIVGVWISYKIMDLFKKDKLWRITVTLKNTKALDECNVLKIYLVIFAVFITCAKLCSVYPIASKDSSA